MSKFDPKIHHRKSIRLKEYDYSQPGAYFVTIVTWRRDCLFGKIVDNEVHLNDSGKTAEDCWRAIPEHFPSVELGAYVVMPNHVHGIIMIVDNHMDVAGRGAIYRAPTTDHAPTPDHTSTTEQFGKPTIGSIPTIIRTYKAAVTRQIGRQHNATGIWQRNYGVYPELVEGNISSATNAKWATSGVISKTTRPCGRKMMKTLST